MGLRSPPLHAAARVVRSAVCGCFYGRGQHQSATNILPTHLLDHGGAAEEAAQQTEQIMNRKLLRSAGLGLAGLVIGAMLAPSVVGAADDPGRPATPVEVVGPVPVPVSGEVSVAATPEPEPFQCRVSGRFDTEIIGTSLGSCIEVPDDQRLRIDDATVSFSGFNNGFVAPEGATAGAFVSTTVNGVSGSHAIGHGSVHTGSDNEEFTSGRTMNLTADPGTEVTIRVRRNYEGDEPIVSVAVSGHLETLE